MYWDNSGLPKIMLTKERQDKPTRGEYIDSIVCRPKLGSSRPFITTHTHGLQHSLVGRVTRSLLGFGKTIICPLIKHED
jgi:hypothetical protein